MSDVIETGDLVRPKYAKPTGLFEVVSINGAKACVIVHKQWHAKSYAKGQTFELSLDLLELMKKGDSTTCQPW